MTGILSLPSELLYAIIETCPEPERCRLRATCKVLNEHADSIVFRRLRLYLKGSPHITEHQIIALATRSSEACEFTTDFEIRHVTNELRATEQSWPHFGHCDDLKVHLPTAISKLKNMTSFRWMIFRNIPDWLINSLMQTVARLPQLTELDISVLHYCERFVPLSLFTNLSKLSVQYSHVYGAFLMTEMATVIANSPQLRSLQVICTASDGNPLPTLSALFAKIPTNNPLCLEHLFVDSVDATVDQVTLPHLSHLISFEFRVRRRDLSIAQSVWTSFLNNNVRLTDVDIAGNITEETMLYLSSFSGLKSLIVEFDNTMIVFEIFEKMLFEMILPKHAKSLQRLWVANTGSGKCVFDRSNSKSIMNCLKLRDLYVGIDGEESSMPMQLVLDTVAHLPELEILHFDTEDFREREEWDGNFKPSPGLRYVEELELDGRWYMLEKVGGRPLRYREIEC